MKIDLLNTEAFSNMAFEQMHNTYMLMREERRKTLEKVRSEAITQLKNKLMEEIHWWQVCDFEGNTVGYGYGTAKAAKKAAKKGLKKSEKPTNFAPEIVGKQYSSDANAKRKIKEYILKNHLIIPPDYEFGVNKIDWGCYEITGTRKQTKGFKKNENRNK